MNDKPRSRLVRNLMRAGGVLFFTVLSLLCLQGWRMGLFRSLDTLQSFIRSKGAWAPVIFLLLHVLQILMAFIPGGIVHAGGVLIFGPWPGLFYNLLGSYLGSSLNFFLARRFGQPLVRHLLEDGDREKYFRWLHDGKKFDRLFAAAILLPLFPDDALCLVAGLSDMTWKRFLLLLLLKIPTVAVYSIVYATAGYLL